MTLIKTRAQIEREKKHQKVISLYKQLKHENPLASPSKIMDAVGLKVGYTIAGIRKILEQNHVPFK